VLAAVPTFAIEGVDSVQVSVEVDIHSGLPAFTVVGLPDAAVREARERVRAALLNSGLAFPQQRLTANLAPADLPKAGPSFDLALAVAVLVASEQVERTALGGVAVCGELSLSGDLRPVRGAIAVALGARSAGFERLVVAVENAAEAALAGGLEVVGVPSLTKLVELFAGHWSAPPPGPARARRDGAAGTLDLHDVRGQEDARRALEIAAAGGHNLLMIGPPGAGKTMLARRLPGILPPPGFDDAVEITKIHSVAGLGEGSLVCERPFRSPHHTISASGLVGGGSTPRPGEITLAHRGVLFLDELAEFSRQALEALRQPLEDGCVEIVRGQRSVVFPARAMLIGACNACPCARPASDCMCSEIDMARYSRRLSGPLLDRIDIVCRLDAPAPLELVRDGRAAGPSSAEVRERVAAARERQTRRLAGTGAASNGGMDGRLTRRHVRLTSSSRELLLEGHRRMALTGRGHDRVLRLARTIADLDGRARVEAADVEEALGYRLGASLEAAA
jgi:magnesium chelatase family protein